MIVAFLHLRKYILLTKNIATNIRVVCTDMKTRRYLKSLLTRERQMPHQARRIVPTLRA